MKKFTVISLLLVLVAGFTFAAGLTPYVASSAGAKLEGTLEDYCLDTNKLTLDGEFTFGATDASELVDVNADFIVKYVDKKAGGADAFTFTPSANVSYSGDNLIVAADAIATFKKTGEDAFAIIKTSEVSKELVLDLDVKYADFYGNKIYKVEGSENLTFKAGSVTPVTYGAVNFYVPVSGKTPKDAMATNALGSTFDGKAGKYIFRAFANAQYKFEAADGKLRANTDKLVVNTGLDYFFYKNSTSNYFNLKADYSMTAQQKAVTAYALTGNAKYYYKAVKGANALDKFEFTANANATTDINKATKVFADATVSIPRLIPVELIDNVSYNLPATFYAKATKDIQEKLTKIEFKATVNPVYVEFKEARKLFGKFVNVLKATAYYGNDAIYDGKIINGVKANHFVFGGALQLDLDETTQGLKSGNSASLKFAYDYVESYRNDDIVKRFYTPVERVYYGEDVNPGKVSISYTTSF